MKARVGPSGMMLEPWFMLRSITEIGPMFDKIGLTWPQSRSLKEAVRDDPDLSTANTMFTDLAQSGSGRFPVPGIPMTFSSGPGKAAQPAPALPGCRTRHDGVKSAGVLRKIHLNLC